MPREAPPGERIDERGTAVTDGELTEALSGIDRALAHAKDAEQWALRAMASDLEGPAQQAWQATQRTIRALELARRSLRAKVGT